jgi:hypothetical protein
MHEDGSDSIHVLLRNYNYDTKELAPNDPFVFTINDLYVEAARAPLVGQIMGGLIYCVGLMYNESVLVRSIADLQERGESTEVLEQQLAAIRAQLGIV